MERLDHAFTVAKDQLAIERLLDPEGTVTPSHLKHFPILYTCTVFIFRIFFFMKMWRKKMVAKEMAPSQSSFHSRPKEEKVGNGMTYV